MNVMYVCVGGCGWIDKERERDRDMANDKMGSLSATPVCSTVMRDWSEMNEWMANKQTNVIWLDCDIIFCSNLFWPFIHYHDNHHGLTAWENFSLHSLSLWHWPSWPIEREREKIYWTIMVVFVGCYK